MRTNALKSKDHPGAAPIEAGAAAKVGKLQFQIGKNAGGRRQFLSLSTCLGAACSFASEHAWLIFPLATTLLSLRFVDTSLQKSVVRRTSIIPFRQVLR